MTTDFLDRLEAAVQETIHRRGDEFLGLLTHSSAAMAKQRKDGRKDGGNLMKLSLLYMKNMCEIDIEADKSRKCLLPVFSGESEVPGRMKNPL